MRHGELLEGLLILYILKNKYIIKATEISVAISFTSPQFAYDTFQSPLGLQE